MANSTANIGHNILESTSFKWPHPMIVKHVILTFEEKNNKLLFKVLEIKETDKVSGLEEMSSYAISKIGTRPAGLVSSPFDIKVKQQCWLLIQLDPSKNWQFTVGQVPCTLKEEDLYGRNIHLRHVQKSSKTGEKGKISRNGCRTIFFGVVQRGPIIGEKKRDPGRCGINLNVEFIQKDGRHTKRLQLIIDPDVPNDGGTTIP